jgi:cyanate lyase
MTLTKHEPGKAAIDFNMQIEREPNPKGDRVKTGMSGKFLLAGDTDS